MRTFLSAVIQELSKTKVAAVVAKSYAGYCHWAPQKLQAVRVKLPVTHFGASVAFLRAHDWFASVGGIRLA